MKKETKRHIIEALVIVILIILFILSNKLLITNNRNSFDPIDDNSSIVYQVENVFYKNENLIIQGWFLPLDGSKNEDLKDKKLGLLLYDIDSISEKNIDGTDKLKKGISADLTYINRNDVIQYFEYDDENYQCGFTAKFDNCLLDDKTYRIVFKPDEKNETGIMSNLYIKNGKLSFIDPGDSLILDLSNTDLNEIIYEGTCLASCPEKNVCIIQVDWKLYLIADEGFEYAPNGETYISYGIVTNQVEKLPYERRSLGLNWDDLSSFFESSEITNLINCGKYRVCVKEIPKEYSVVMMNMGYYSEEEWKWNLVFRPVYSFN